MQTYYIYVYLIVYIHIYIYILFILYYIFIIYYTCVYTPQTPMMTKGFDFSLHSYPTYLILIHLIHISSSLLLFNFLIFLPFF